MNKYFYLRPSQYYNLITKFKKNMLQYKFSFDIQKRIGRIGYVLNPNLHGV